MKRKLQEFLDLVDCRPEEVLDVPLKRRGVPPESYGSPLATAKARKKSLGKFEVYFGMHKGKQLKEVPRSYMEWALGKKPTNRSFRKFQRMASEYLSAIDTEQYQAA